MSIVYSRGRRSALLTCLCMFLLGLLGTRESYGSTYVGNPSNVTLAPITNVVITDFALPLDMVETRACNASTGNRVAPVTVAGKQEFYIPPGTCELRLELDDDVLVSGTASGGAEVDLELDTPAVLVLLFEEPFDPANETDRYLVEIALPGWTSAAELLPNGAPSAYVTPASPLHDGLVDALVAGTAVFANPNGDGVVNGSERTPGPLAETP